MTRLFLLLYGLLFSSSLCAQQKIMEAYFSQIRSGKYPSIPIEATLKDNAAIILSALPTYLHDSVSIVRARASSLSKLIGAQSKLGTIRTKAIQQLIEAVKDKDTGNAGSALTFLTEFNKSDFSEADRDTLYAIFKRKSAHLNTFIRLMGYLEMQSAKDDLFNLSQNTSLSRKDRWAAMLALARMNDDQAATDVMNRVKRMPVSDAVLYEIFPDLIYTRRPEAINYLVEALHNDAKNCESANSDNPERIPCAYRIMEMLAPIIENYPLKQNATGDIETNDYPAALQKAREWLKVNKNYKILKDRY
jgi:hypothetical protein